MAFWLLLSALLVMALGVLPPFWFARRRPGYSHVRSTVSELGESGAPDALRVAWLGFAPAGLAVLVFSALLHAQLTSLGADGTAAVLLSLLGVSYVGAAVFPCDAGAPFWGTWKNQMHNLVAGLGYFGAGAGLLEMKRVFEDLPTLAPLSPISGLLGPVILLGVFVLSFESPVRGLIQRTVEGLVFGWMLVVGAWLMAA
ncbi:DUF998 domain-containing protein [Comamonas sp. JC664]|uniref:DUF998 domain-containing protein n=1 Tax=Comamonas sp. JC664 TaxID=2801917 RepID=UPI0017486EF5|nr:DUF998 domain-containing protein [Comamonas sp. JC664]MBL0692868.1 DUF998 domain-containing protein [Comamonas sp. JC664]GHG90943.1 hypothetical protein GCM10012319_51350 [Comamonas sp. KCTC 72670]